VRVRERRAELEADVIDVIAVGFSPAERLAELAEYLAWPWPFLSDQRRLLYRRLHLPRAGLLYVYTPATLLRYARALLHGQRIQLPVEDTRQLGGDAIVEHGSVRRLYRPRTPDDRVPVDELIRTAAQVRGQVEKDRG
jgi:hypothetical protein